MIALKGKLNKNRDQVVIVNSWTLPNVKSTKYGASLNLIIQVKKQREKIETLFAKIERVV